MSSIQFDEPESRYRAIDISPKADRNTKRAYMAMLVTSIVCIIASLLIIKFFLVSDKKYKEDYSQEELERMLPEAVKKLPSSK